MIDMFLANFRLHTMDRLFHLLFFSGFCSFIGGISRQYVLIQEQKTWYQAQAYCRENHIDLATVQNDDDWANLRETVNKMAKMAWVGLYNDVYSWRWSYQDENITFQKWRAGEPNNNDGHEACGLKESKIWNDMDCNGVFPFFCFNENRTNRFVFVSDAKTWQEAQSYCRHYYTDMAIISSQSEEDQITEMMKSHPSAWLGLFRDKWKWSDATNVSTSSLTWLTAQPDVVTLENPCGVSDPDGMIHYQLCSNDLPFLCMQRTKKQIVRVKVNVKSGQNVNDPTVMKVILQWIKQKLKESGLEKETRVAWRVQPNGNVFSDA
ncbi:macrophage mannose receptor 1-like [Megalobrama amblycephala]|uniref:macrophage mannose receptor 1-like n=1 Tax=Megalobrama amblycephala TaxID=75352 RepID=UPI002013F718|nr:macrophage mannose receptor 1-like [Megalobrama amblycephala]